MYVETDEQLLGYVYLNPVASFLLKLEDLESLEYIGENKIGISDTLWIQTYSVTTEGYRKFVYHQASYAQELEKIKHLSVDG